MARITSDPEEQERILKLHLEATKRHYLKEEDYTPQSTLKNADIDYTAERFIEDNVKYTIDVADDGVSVAGETNLKGKQFTRNDIIKAPVDRSLYFKHPKGIRLVATARGKTINVFAPLDQEGKKR